MILVEEAVGVERPAEGVFEFLVDVGRLPGWLPAIERAELIDGGEGGGASALAVGSRLRLMGRGPMGRFEAVAEVTELVRPEVLALRSLSGPASVVAALRVSPLGAGCRLAVRAEVGLTGGLRFAEGMVRSRVAKEAPAAMAALRDVIEREVPPGQAE